MPQQFIFECDCELSLISFRKKILFQRSYDVTEWDFTNPSLSHCTSHIRADPILYHFSLLAFSFHFSSASVNHCVNLRIINTRCSLVPLSISPMPNASRFSSLLATHSRGRRRDIVCVLHRNQYTRKSNINLWLGWPALQKPRFTHMWV